MTVRAGYTGRAGRGGFSLLELMVALLVFGIVMTGALGFLSIQVRGFRHGMDRMSTLQTIRYAVQSMEMDVLALATNVVFAQPEIVVAGEDVFAFNADYATNVENDLFAVFYDPDAPTGQVTAIVTKITIPNTSFGYPSRDYTTTAGTRSPAELLTFFFAEDTTTSRTDDYALYRQVNDAPPEMVARNLLQTAGAPFFRYYRDNFSVLDSIPDAMLPLYHTAEVHLGPEDEGMSALIDSIRAVRVTLTATNGREGDRERTAQLSRTLRIPNIGYSRLETCGDVPILGVGLTATAVTLPTGEDVVNLSWPHAVDEVGGEEDVVRYVIYRRKPSEGWGDPYLSIPAGKPAYTYQDAAVQKTDVWIYGLAAQDCTPSLSPITSSGLVPII